MAQYLDELLDDFDPVGLRVGLGVIIVRPRKGSPTWRAWRDGKWRAIYRMRGVGWIWAE
jgi:hypothetical protein